MLVKKNVFKIEITNGNTQFTFSSKLINKYIYI